MVDHLGGDETVLDELMLKGKIEVQHLGFIRGRDIKNAIIYVTEVQSNTREHIQLLLSRVSDGSQIWFNGDSEQTDSNKFKYNNGKKIMLTDELRKKWLRKDSSFDDDEILELEKYFVDMKNDFSIENTSAINLLYELSVLSVKKQRALSDDNISGYDKLDKSFQNKLKVSGFQPIDEKDSSNIVTGKQIGRAHV